MSYMGQSNDNKREKILYSFVKRILDVTLALVLLIILIPVMVVISILIKLDSKGPVLLKQTRVGRYSKEFIIYKFRTMDVDSPEVPTHQSEYRGCNVTKIGNTLRKTSLDEIPQLINILKFEMSFVGPRPLIKKEKKILSKRKDLGIDIALPGITGWAQVNGRDELKINEKLKYDLEYVKSRSIQFDIYIMFVTIFKVIKSEGIK